MTPRPLKVQPTASPGLDAARFRRALLAWYDAERRDLPWRRTRDPYAIWLSEVMLQQTQVATVIPYWHAFLERFPTVSALAAASDDDVLARWSGLGYYSRARNMLRAARAMVERHDARLPASFEALAALPGVGPYTAAAVASIAFGLPHAVLDGNVARVICRLEALTGDDRTPANRAILAREAERLLAPGRPSDFNQAMMELGALVCTPRSPGCSGCPVATHCQAFHAGDAERYPERASRPKSVAVDWTAVLVELGGRLLLVRSASPGLFTGMWELPWLDRPPQELASGLSLKYGLQVTHPEPFGRVRHTVTYRRITLHCLSARLEPTAVREAGADRRWATPGELGEIGLSSIAAKVLAAWRKHTARAR
ncbi:MAG: A/G-specific adenine glycosylase [Candidatus Wallbacteria bacterium]|nr:A/G-specific adenine glycosylase [Candidatus Wallbacteria bacterium]